MASSFAAGGGPAGRGRLRAALVTPLSGPLAVFGRAGARALRLWAESLGSGDAVAVDVHDAHPDAAAAMREATASRPDLVFGPYGSGPARRAVAATDRLVWNHGGASGRLTWDRAPNVVNVLAAADTYFEGALEAIAEADAAAGRVVLLHVDTGFGREIAGGAAARAADLGLRVASRAFPPGRAEEALADVPGGDVLCVAGGFDDELALARGLLERPWRAAVLVGAGEREVLAELGERRAGLLGPAQWLASAARPGGLGPSPEWFVAAHRRAHGHDPSYPAAQALAAGVVAAECVRTAGTTDDDELRDAAASLDTTTLLGRFRLDPVTGRQVGHGVLTVQWQQGERRVVWPPERAVAPLRPLDRSA